MGRKKPKLMFVQKSDFAIQKICKNRTKIISEFEPSGSRIKRFRRPERSDVDEMLLKRFKCKRTDSVAVGGPLVTVRFVVRNW